MNHPAHHSADPAAKPSALLRVGDVAPDFTLSNQQGDPVKLSYSLASGWVVLFFYPKDASPLCTAQACAFRNTYDAFLSAGASVMGISADSIESHQRFAQAQKLPFALLSDLDGAVADSYGVTKTFGLIPGRVTFVIDPQQTIRLVYNSQFTAKAHMEKALALLQQASQPASPA